MIQINQPDYFFLLQHRFPHIPFSQSKAWFTYLKSKGKSEFVFYVDDENDTKIATWGRVEKIPILGGHILRFDGETCQNGINEKIIKKFYTEISETDCKAIEINSNNIYNIEFEIGIRRAGFIRPMSFYACPLSIEIELQQVFNFDRNWKRNVKKAEALELAFFEVSSITDDILLDIIEMFKEMATLKQLSYSLEFESLKQLTISNGIRTFLVSDKNGKLIAARILHEHNKYLTDVFAANSLVARECGATYFMMESIFKQLKNEEKDYFDFGRIPPSNHSSDSVYVFKNASRGRKIHYNGEWVFFKKKWIEMMLFAYKSFFIRKQRY